MVWPLPSWGKLPLDGQLGYLYSSKYEVSDLEKLASDFYIMIYGDSLLIGYNPYHGSFGPLLANPNLLIGVQSYHPLESSQL